MQATHDLLVPSQPLLLRYTLEVPLPTPSNNQIKNLHFREYSNLRQTWAQLLLEALRTQGHNPPYTPIQKAWLSIDRHCAGSGLDWDNAYGGLKPVLDCLTPKKRTNPNGLGLINEDNPRCIPWAPQLRQLSAPMGMGFSKIHIYEIGDPSP